MKSGRPHETRNGPPDKKEDSAPEDTRGVCEECKALMRAEDDGWTMDLEELQSCGCAQHY